MRAEDKEISILSPYFGISSPYFVFPDAGRPRPGDIAVVFSKSPTHKHYAFADLEWMILPAVVTGQFYVAELQHTEIGARAPVAAVL